MGMVVGERGTPWCRHSVRRRSRIDPCTSGHFRVGRACVWSVYGHVAAAAVVLLVRGRVSCLFVGLLGVGSLALQQALAQSDLVRGGALLVSVSVGASCVQAAWYIFTVRRPPTVGDKSNDKWFDRCKTFSNLVPFSLPRPRSVTCTTHHLVLRCALLAVFPASPVPFICTPPVGGKALSVPLGASLCFTSEPQGAVSARLCGARARVCLPAVCRIVP